MRSVVPVIEIEVIELVTPGPQGPSGLSSIELPFITDFMRIKATGELQVWNSDQNKYHTLLVQGSAGAEYITIGAGEV